MPPTKFASDPITIVAFYAMTTAIAHAIPFIIVVATTIIPS